jgi:hypothetical protein
MIKDKTITFVMNLFFWIIITPVLILNAIVCKITGKKSWIEEMDKEVTDDDLWCC